MPEGNSGGVALPVTFRLPDNPVPVDSLPETRDLQIQTLLPANQLAERFSEPSVRFLSVTRQLENGRFRYQFTGKYYAR